MARIDALSLLGALTLALAPAMASAAPSEPTRPTLAAGTAKARAGASVAGPNGAEWRLPGGPQIVAAPGAVLRVLHVPQPLQLGPGASVPGYTVIVQSGKVEVVVPAGAKSAVVVVAPRQVSAIVRTGAFRIATGSTQSAVATASGVSTLSVAGGAFRELPVGQVYVAAGGSGQTRALVSPPTRLQGRRVVLTQAAQAQIGKLSWDSVPGAVGYRAELLDARTGTVVAGLDTAGPVLDAGFAAQPVGLYRVRVSAYDSSGIASGGALESSLHVVGIEVPPGGYSDRSGTIRLGQGQKVRLVGAEGLELTYGGDRFVRAPETVGLFRDDSTAVHLRIPGTHDFATARLAPRTVRARIEIGPRRAVWPTDPIEIRIRLEDPSGEPIPDSIEAKPRVQLGVHEIAVPFVRQGGWLRGVVQPRPGAGPWVLRVAVEDGASEPLGYDFVEIARAPVPKAKRLGVPVRLGAVSRR